MPQASLYDDDIVTWSDQQASELRRLAASAPTNAVDWDNVIEEIECLGRSEPKGGESHLVQALAHILMFETQPSSLSALGWASEVEIALAEARRDFRPLMRQHIDMNVVWGQAFRRATASLNAYNVRISPSIPQICPYALNDLLDEAASTDTLRTRLHSLL